jgi:hypothetical protein
MAFKSHHPSPLVILTMVWITVFALAICVTMQNPVTAISGTLSQTQWEKLKAISPSPNPAAASGIRRPKPRTRYRASNRIALTPTRTSTRQWGHGIDAGTKHPSNTGNAVMQAVISFPFLEIRRFLSV